MIKFSGSVDLRSHHSTKIMKLTELVPEIESSGYSIIPIYEEDEDEQINYDQCREILVIPPSYNDEKAAIGVKEAGLYYRIAPVKWFRQKEDREQLESFLKMLTEVHSSKIFD